jgi:hypothetical protein
MKSLLGCSAPIEGEQSGTDHEMSSGSDSTFLSPSNSDESVDFDAGWVQLAKDLLYNGKSGICTVSFNTG